MHLTTTLVLLAVALMILGFLTIFFLFLTYDEVLRKLGKRCEELQFSQHTLVSSLDIVKDLPEMIEEGQLKDRLNRDTFGKLRAELVFPAQKSDVINSLLGLYG